MCNTAKETRLLTVEWSFFFFKKKKVTCQNFCLLHKNLKPCDKKTKQKKTCDKVWRVMILHFRCYPERL